MDEREYYEKIAIKHDSIQAVMHSPVLLAKYRDFLERAVLKKTLKRGNKKIIDIGCGNGRFFDLFKLKGYNITGIDFSKNLVKQAKHKYPYVEIKVSNSEKIPFKSNSFDYAFLLLLLSHVNYTKFKDTITEAARVTKEGGRLFILDEPYTKGSVWNKERLDQELIKVNFKFVESKFVRFELLSKILSLFIKTKNIIEINENKSNHIKSSELKSLIRVFVDSIVDLPFTCLKVKNIGFEQLLIYEKKNEIK